MNNISFIISMYVSALTMAPNGAMFKIILGMDTVPATICKNQQSLMAKHGRTMRVQPLL